MCISLSSVLLCFTDINIMNQANFYILKEERGRLTGLVWVQLVVGQQNEAAGLQQTLLDVQSEAGGLKSDQLQPPGGLATVQPQSAHVKGFVQEPEARRTLGHRLQLKEKTHTVSYGSFSLSRLCNFLISYETQHFLKKEETAGISADLEG